jgi:hypothetical protein
MAKPCWLPPTGWVDVEIVGESVRTAGGQRKLTSTFARAALLARADGMTQSEVAAIYGVDRSSISRAELRARLALAESVGNGSESAREREARREGDSE